MATVVLAEDRYLRRHELRAAMEVELDLHIVDEAEDGWEAWDKAERLKPDMLIINSEIPGMTAWEIAQHALATPLRTRMVIIRGDNGWSYVYEAIAGGVMGFLMKTTGNKELVRKTREIIQGRFVPQSAYFWSHSVQPSQVRSTVSDKEICTVQEEMIDA